MNGIAHETRWKLSPWLKEISHLNPSEFNLSRSLRTSVAIAAPMLVGYLADILMYTMWISMGAMFPSIGERDAPYVFTIKKILISAPIGISGFFMGYFGHLGIDWGWIVLLMAVVGFIASILSSYNATVSIGCLQFMVMAAVSLGNSHITSHVVPVCFMFVGVLFYFSLLMIEILISPHQIRKDSILKCIDALVNLCDVKVRGSDVSAASLEYSKKFDDLYKFMLQMRYQALGHNAIFDKTADIVQSIDSVFQVLMAEKDIEKVKAFLSDLTLIKDNFKSNNTSWRLPATELEGLESLNVLAVSVFGGGPGKSPKVDGPPHRLSFRVVLEKLTPGGTALKSALALMLCTAIGYSFRWLDDTSHWYWVPMTVSIVMKPELGSIFARAVQRTIGTAAGVVVGGLILAALPVGILFIIIIAAIGFVMPWLSQKNYALSAFSLTPFVLVLIDFMAPTRNPFDYASLRLMDTLIGCAIVLIFGYLLWPKRHTNEFYIAMQTSWASIGNYLGVVIENRDGGETTKTGMSRCMAYGKLVDMRATLQKSMSEPPPIGYEAAGWFPLVAAAGNLTDQITIYAGRKSGDLQKPIENWLIETSRAISKMEELPALPKIKLDPNSAESQLIGSILKTAAMRGRFYTTQPSVSHL